MILTDIDPENRCIHRTYPTHLGWRNSSLNPSEQPFSSLLLVVSSKLFINNLQKGVGESVKRSVIPGLWLVLFTYKEEGPSNVTSHYFSVVRLFLLIFTIPFVIQTDVIHVPSILFRLLILHRHPSSLNFKITQVPFGETTLPVN